MAKSPRRGPGRPEGKKAALKRRTTKLYREVRPLLQAFLACYRTADGKYEREVKRSGIESRRLTQHVDGKKPARRDPLGKAKGKAEELRTERAADEKARQDARQRREKQEAQRRRKARGLLKRSKKGQPIMKNMAKHLLEKVQKMTQ
eukprot:scaffold336_cov250-Pinguiococcus_pyrenoidosus.AAC.29